MKLFRRLLPNNVARPFQLSLVREGAECCRAPLARCGLVLVHVIRVFCFVRGRAQGLTTRATGKPERLATFFLCPRELHPAVEAAFFSFTGFQCQQVAALRKDNARGVAEKPSELYRTFGKSTIHPCYHSQFFYSQRETTFR